MTTSLMVWAPLILLAIVGTLCFVGCILPEYTYVEDYTAYTGKTVLPTSTVMAYWPLKETKDTDAAVDLISKNNGKYIDPNTADAGIYPWRKYSVPNGSNPDVLSAAGTGDIQ